MKIPGHPNFKANNAIMKRNLHYVSVFLLGILSYVSVTAQDVYWREGFNGGTIPTVQPSAASNTGYYGLGESSGLTGNSGDSWYVFGAYRTTGTSCPAPYGAYHIRFRNAAISLPDSPFIVTPVVNNGIQTVNITHTRADKNITIFWTPDTSATTTNWTLAGVFDRWQPTCTNLSMSINQATAKRIKIVSRQSTDADEDSVWLTSMTPLPVKFSGISAAFNSGAIKVNWQTATEIDIDNYLIERSANGVEFQIVGNVPAKENSTSLVNYAWIDNSPLNGINYYRIIAVEKNGKKSYTSVVKVNGSKSGVEINVAPNPVRNGDLNMQLSSVRKGTYAVKVYNNVGQVVFTTQFSTEGGSLTRSFKLPVTARSGIYSLQLTGNDINVTKKIVIE